MPVTAVWPSVVTRSTSSPPLRQPCCSAASAKSSPRSAKSMKQALPTDWVTGWHMTSVAPGGIQKSLDGCFVQHAVDILSRERKSFRKRRNNRSWGTSPRSLSDKMPTFRKYHHIWREEGQRATAHCRSSPLSGSLRAGLTPQERSLVTSIWTRT